MCSVRRSRHPARAAWTRPGDCAGRRRDRYHRRHPRAALWNGHQGRRLSTDKIFLSAVYISLAAISRVPRWLVIEIFARDFLILAGCGAAILALHIHKFPPSVWGKASTFLQILCALVVMIGNAAPDSGASRWAAALFWPVAALTAFSGIHYLWRGLRRIDGGAVWE